MTRGTGTIEAPTAKGSKLDESSPRPADVLVVFGITGDLAKVMTFHSLYRLEQRGLLDCPIVGVAVDDWTDDQLRDRARESIEGTGETIDEKVFDRLADRLSYVAGDFGDAATLRAGRAGDRRSDHARLLPRDPAVPVRQRRQGARRAGPDEERAASWWRSRSGTTWRRRASSPTSSTSTSTSRSSTESTTTSGRWGSRRSSTSGSRTRSSSRSGTGTTSSRVQITMAEDFGVEDRGHFYDPVGALRDVVVNHLMQVVAAAAMEAPSGGDPTSIKDMQVALFKAVKEADPAHYVRGQYEGYLDIDGVATDSTTETYAALRLEIENWRWSGVPFFIRTGKRLPATQTEVRLVFKHPPRLGFGALRAATRSRIRSRSGSTRRPESSSSLDAHRADRQRSGGDHARHGVRGGRR